LRLIKASELELRLEKLANFPAKREEKAKLLTSRANFLVAHCNLMTFWLAGGEWRHSV